MRCQSVVYVSVILLAVAPVSAQFDSGSDGSDGAFTAGPDETIIDLSLAATAPWDTASPAAGRGVYDAARWAVVFKFTTINIPFGSTVKFKNHPSGAPVVWLASGDVNIQGTVDLSGQDAFGTTSSFTYSNPGPGGFAGGAAFISSTLSISGGFGPGGGDQREDGVYGGAYGSPSVIPLIGGSGGGGSTALVGGAGGGAILIAASGDIGLSSGLLAGSITCDGGTELNNSGAGSGGAIRLIANEITGAGTLQASGGRIRLEAFSNSFSGTSLPPFSFAGPGPVFPPSIAPVLRATAIDGNGIPLDPRARIGTVDVLVQDSLTILDIEAMNIPISGTVTVFVKPAHGAPAIVQAEPLKGSFALSTTQALLFMPEVPVEIQLRANW